MIPLTLTGTDKPIWIRSDEIQMITYDGDTDGSVLYISNSINPFVKVKESPNQIMNLNQFY